MNCYIISAGYNANINAINCIESVQKQTENFKMHFYINDMSNDNTHDIVNNHMYKNNLKNFTYINNKQKKYRLKNIHDIVMTLKDDPEGIVLLLDGDDWFSRIDVIEKVIKKYNEKDYEYVYTNWVYSHAPILGISKEIPDNNFEPYKDPWITSAMATFKVKTFLKIPTSNFLDENGEYFKLATDQAYILPILTILKKESGDYSKVGFINEPLYVYQFIENEKRRRYTEEGNKERVIGHNSSLLIRERGFLDE